MDSIDAVVIGAGVIGLAIARELALRGQADDAGSDDHRIDAVHGGSVAVPARRARAAYNAGLRR